MIAWTEQQGMIRDMIRDFVEKEIVPHIDDLEYNGLPPYDILRKLFSTFGMDELANTRFDKQIAREEAQAAGNTVDAPDNINRENSDVVSTEALDAVAMGILPIVEISRQCQGLITAMGVSVGLTGGAIMSKGSLAQKKKYSAIDDEAFLLNGTYEYFALLLDEQGKYVELKDTGSYQSWDFLGNKLKNDLRDLVKDMIDSDIKLLKK